MREDDRPPERIWLDDGALAEHFERVHDRYASDGKSGEWEAVPDLEQNELTRGLR